MSPTDVLEFAKKNNAVMVDLKFSDLFSRWHHFSVPISELNQGAFEAGFGFDGSSIRAWKAINNSDMLIVPDPNTAVMDTVTSHPTLSMICSIKDPVTGELYDRDPRSVAIKAEKHLLSTGIGDTIYIGPEAEFFVFDSVRFDSREDASFYHIDSEEAAWNSGSQEGPQLGYKTGYKEGYFPVAPLDTLQDIRTEMVLELQKVGITIEAQHHEVGTAGQCEIDMRFESLVKMADHLNWYKYIIKNVAVKHGKTVTFMPKPIWNDNGNGMHVHQSIWKKGEPLFAGDDSCGLSELARYYIGGIIKHARSVCAFTNPTTNSYKRLVPGFEAPINLCYSGRNRSASIRIPVISPNPKAKRIETRFPDPACTGYLGFSALLMAGLDGIKNKIDPGAPVDGDLFEMSAEELAKIPSVPGSLDEAFEALKEDHEYLLNGNVFTKDLIDTWIEYKTKNEIDNLKKRPHPEEFKLYFDI